MKAILRKLSVAAALAGLLLTGSQALAADQPPQQIAIGMMPTLQDVTLTAGQSGDYEVTVVNDGTVALNVSMSAAPYAMADDYSANVFDAPSTRTQITEWVAFADGESQFRLDGGSQKLVHFSVNVPLDAAAGGQYAAITALGQLEGGGSGLAASYQIASLFLAEVDGLSVRGGEVVDRQFGGWYGSPDVLAKLSVRNTGNTHFFATNRLIVENFFGGGEVARVESSPNLVFGDDARQFELAWTAPQPVGLYYFTLESDFLGGTDSERRLALTLPIWVIIAVFALILILITLVIVKIKKRKGGKK